ncbi:MAG: DUF669 domain-containing protein [Planctomycetota bacterium]
MNDDFNDSIPFSEDIDLSQFDDEFATTEIQDKEFDDLPDGKFQVKIEKAELTRSKRKNLPMLKWTLRILNGPFAGRLLWRNNLIVTPDNLKWLKTDLFTCGLVLDKASDLKKRLPDLLDLKLEVTKRTRNGNENVFLNRLMEAREVDETYEQVKRDAFDRF